MKHYGYICILYHLFLLWNPSLIWSASVCLRTQMVHRHGFWTSLGTMVSFYVQHPIAHSYGSAWHQILLKSLLFNYWQTHLCGLCLPITANMNETSHGQNKQDVSETKSQGTVWNTSEKLLDGERLLVENMETGWRSASPTPSLFPGCRPLDGEQERGRKLFLSGSEFGSGSTFLFPPVLSTTLFRSVFHRSAMWKILEHIAVKVMDGSPVRNGGVEGKVHLLRPSQGGCVCRGDEITAEVLLKVLNQTIGMRSRLALWFKFHCAYSQHSSFVWLWAASHSC